MDEFHLKSFIGSYGFIILTLIVLVVLMLVDVLGGNEYSRAMDQHVDKNATVRFKEVLVDSTGKLSNRVGGKGDRITTENSALFHLNKNESAHKPMLRLENESTGHVSLDFVSSNKVYNLGVEHNSGDPIMKLALPTDTTTSSFHVTNNSGNNLLKVDGAGGQTFYGATTDYDMSWQRSNNRLLFNDNATLAMGTGADFTVSHDGTNTTATSAVGDFILDNTLATGSTIMRLGTDTSATDFQVQNNSGTAILTVNAAGDVDIGATGTVTQATSITTGVTLNRRAGTIVTQSASAAADAAHTFTVTNSTVTAASSILVSITNYAGTIGTNGNPQIIVDNKTAGTFDVIITNGHGTNALSGALHISFWVLGTYA